MGADAFVSERAVADDQPAASAPKRGVDLALLVVVIALLVFGLTMMFSASWDYSLQQYGSPIYMFERQAMWLALGIVIAFVFSRFDYHNWRRLVVPALGLTILLLIAVLLVNE